MTISLKTHKILWGRAAGRCSHPECRLDVFYDEDEADTPSLVGEMCHIIAENDGQRADATMPIEQKNAYANLILLCRNHHRIIDDPTNGEVHYPVARLHDMKRQHEAWVRDQLGFDAEKQAEEEEWSQIIDGWEKLCHVEHWTGWSSSILSHGQPEMSKQISDDLEQARAWILKRIWPHRYEKLKDAFLNFRSVLEAFHNTFLEHADLTGDIYRTRKFYKDLRVWDEKKYRHISDLYDYHVDLVNDLMLELTRAANLICDLVRQYVFRGYRRQEGRLTVLSGPDMSLSFREWVVQYEGGERKEKYPFHGLEKFVTERATRDGHFGSGPEPTA
jgi:hypothetical protein